MAIDELDYAKKLGFRWRRHNAEVEDEKHTEGEANLACYSYLMGFLFL